MYVFIYLYKYNIYIYMSYKWIDFNDLNISVTGMMLRIAGESCPNRCRRITATLNMGSLGETNHLMGILWDRI